MISLLSNYTLRTVYMRKTKFSVAIIGVGGRGGYAYGNIIKDMPDMFEIVALCDIKEEKLAYFSEQFGVSADNLFVDEEEFFLEKRADVLIISTQDKDHVRHTEIAFRLGYDVLLEKPITDNREELESLLTLQRQTGCRALVGHVLRYSPAFTKVARMIEGGDIGRLVSINAIEQVGYFHMAQSFVRGSWRRREGSVPMILAKCSHDLDLIQYYANSQCDTLSSVGELTHFTRENAPEGAAERCVDCTYQITCPYSAKTEYLDKWLNKRCEGYPYNVIASSPITEEKIRAAVESGPYGRCVYRCDNDVVDHQLTQMTFKNGVKATLTMIAFSRLTGRRMDFYGTNGQITLDTVRDLIRVGIFGKAEYDIKISELDAASALHGGGDHGIVLALYDMLTGNATDETSLERSAESHLIAIAAEKSRESGGELVRVH